MFNQVRLFHGFGREDALLAARERRCEIVLTTYGMVAKNYGDLANVAWDLTVWDEVHTLRNPKTASSQAARSIPCRKRFGLTGTPMSNDYMELWVVRAICAYLSTAQRA